MSKTIIKTNSDSGSVSVGANPLVTDNVQSDNITNKAGTGAPDLSNGLTVSGGTTITALDAGTYTPGTPPLSPSNASSVTYRPAYYQRVGNTVTMAGSLDATFTASTCAIIYLVPPIASDFTATDDVAGTCNRFDPSAQGAAGRVFANSGSDVIGLDCYITQSGSYNMNYSISYEVK